MRIAVLSGKGGTGKTFVAVNLAWVAEKATYIDCDVEAPNGRLFFNPENTQTKPVATRLPAFDGKKCNGCRKCVDFCRFNALAFIKDTPLLFTEVCHSCGGCALVCPTHAITEVQKNIGMIEWGERDSVHVVTGIMNVGEASGIPIIKSALSQPCTAEELTIIDCPPGSACSVMESIQNADYCLLVAEPTAFGFHNFQMVYELVHLLKKNCGVLINKEEDAYAPLDTFCIQHNLNVLCHIPYNGHLASLSAKGEIAVRKDQDMKELFSGLLSSVLKEVSL